MTKPNDGGPAFPARPTEHLSSGATITAHNGMSLRDYLAGRALAAIDYNDYRDAELAKKAYAVADAMIAAREASK